MRRAPSSESSPAGFWSEVRLIASHAVTVWRMIAPGDRWALILAVVLMAGISVCNTVFPLVQGRMLDAIQGAADDPGAVYQTAVFFLLAIAGIFLVREIVQV